MSKATAGISPFGIVLFVFSAVLLFSRAYVGWLPWDDGTMGHAAQRILHGDLPHRDFFDTHTGLLSYIHAIVFQIAGENLNTLRSFIVVSWLGILALLIGCYTNRREPHTFLALAVIVVLCAANHVSSLPTWYGTFATIVLAVVLTRGLTTNRLHQSSSEQSSSERGTLTPLAAFLIGALISVSFLIKVTALYLFAAVILIELYSRKALSDEKRGEDGLLARVLPLLVCLAGVLYLLLPSHSVSGHSVSGHSVKAAITAALSCFLPSLLLLVFLLYRSSWSKRLSLGSEIAELLRVILQLRFLLLGFSIPLAIFLFPYLLSGSLYSWVEGVFVAPQRRFSHAEAASITLAFVLCADALLLVVLWMYSKLGSRSIRQVFLFVWFSALCLAPLGGSLQMKSVLGLFYVWQPILIAISLFVLQRNKANAEPRDAKRLFALSTIAAFHSLLQYPFYNEAYLFYVLPLYLLLSIELYRWLAPKSRMFLLTTLAAMLVLGFEQNISRGMVLTKDLAVGPQRTAIAAPRGGLYLTQAGARRFEELIETVQTYAKGRPVFAMPDCPEVYFLTGASDPQRSLFDFLDTDPNREATILRTIEERQVLVFVINRQPTFSPKLEPEFLKQIEEIFPNQKALGRYEVRWRESTR